MIALLDKLLREVPMSVFPGRSGPYRFIVRDGGEGPADTRQAFVFSEGKREPTLIVKMARNRRGAELLRGEHANLTRLSGAPEEWFRLSVPRPIFYKERQGYAFLAETVLPGKRVKDGEPGCFLAPERLAVVADWLAAFAAFAGKKERIDRGLVRQHVEEVAARYLETFEVTRVEWDVLQGLGEEAAVKMRGGELLLAPCHGDFCDANLMWDGEHLGVIDWDAPLVPQVPFVDLFYALLSFALGGPGLATAQGFRRGFDEAFIARGTTSKLCAEAVKRYARGIGADPSWVAPIFIVTWCRFALAKVAYLEETHGRIADPSAPRRDRRQWLADLNDAQQSFPLVHFDGASCLNVRLACESHGRSGLEEGIA